MKEELSSKNAGIFEGGPFVIFLSPLLSPHFRKKEKEKTGLNYRIRLNEYIKRRSILHFVITMLIWTPDAFSGVQSSHQRRVGEAGDMSV